MSDFNALYPDRDKELYARWHNVRHYLLDQLRKCKGIPARTLDLLDILRGMLIRV